MEKRFVVLVFSLLGIIGLPDVSRAQKKIDWNVSPWDEGHRGAIGQTFTYVCPSIDTVSFGGWGTDIYTDDSNICPAAVHAGVITTAGGTVTIKMQPSPSSFRGSVRRGVTTQDHGPFPSAFVFVMSGPQPPAQTSDLTGLWIDNSGGAGVYRLRQIGKRVYWASDGTSQGRYANVFIGDISGNIINGTWVDLPGSPALGGGNMTLRIESNSTLVKVSESSCCYGAQSWTRKGR